jgi:hypothetical protein
MDSKRRAPDRGKHAFQAESCQGSRLKIGQAQGSVAGIINSRKALTLE